MDGWMDEWATGWVGGWLGGWMDGCLRTSKVMLLCKFLNREKLNFYVIFD
jgi:hypothetical protein